MAVHNVTLENITPGYSISCTYKAPDKGTIGFNFDGSNGEIVFHASIRYDDKSLVLNTRTDADAWGDEERPSGFLFSPTYDTTVRVDITPEGYELYCNGKKIFLYKHRMDVKNIIKFRWEFADNAATKKPVLKSVEIHYPCVPS